MALTQKEISARNYRYRKENRLCVRCNKKLNNTENYYCASCREKKNEYVRETKKFCVENHICTYCRKERVYGNDRMCFECRAKCSGYQKNVTKEQKIKYANNRNIKKREQYKERKLAGICVRCGKLKAVSGKSKCGVCLEIDARRHREKYIKKPSVKKYREENNLCFYCGNPIDRESGNVCTSCYDKCVENGKKGSANNHYWRNDNREVFRK